MTDTFAHELRLDQIRDGDRLDLTADEAERAAIARRLGLDSLDRLDAHAVFARTGDVILAQGRLLASLAQSCAVTNDPVASHIDEPFDLKFIPEPPGSNDEVELGASDCDVVFHDGAQIDLGGAIADSLALSIDPYPRSAGADAALKEAAILGETEAGPFAALAKLRRTDES